MDTDATKRGAWASSGDARDYILAKNLSHKLWNRFQYGGLADATLPTSAKGLIYDIYPMSSKLSIYCALGLCLSGCDTKDNLEQSQSPARPLTSINKSGATSLAPPIAYRCKYEERFAEGGSIGAEVELGIAQGKISKLAVSSFITSGEEGGAYMCDINTSDKGQSVKWPTLNQKFVLNISESVIEIEPMGRAYKIHLAGASRENCGFGAEWPEYVVIEPGNPKCRIKD